MSYGDMRTAPVLTKLQGLVDEGTYFVANNAQTGIAMTAANAFSATAPFLVIDNNNPAPSAGGAGINVVPDYLRLLATAAGGAASGMTYIAFALYLDTIKRYSTGGTTLTGASPNTNLAPTSNAFIHAGTVTAAAASAARAMVGQASMRPAVSATVACVVGDQFVIDFGSIEGGMAGSITVANPEMISVPVPPVIIGPQCSALLYVWFPSSTTPSAASFAPELGYWER